MHPGAYKNGFVLFNVTKKLFSWEYLFYGHYLNVLNDLSWMYWMPFPECTEWPFLNVLNDLSWVYWMTFPKCTEWPFLNVLNDLSWMYWMTFPECTEWPFLNVLNDLSKQGCAASQWTHPSVSPLPVGHHREEHLVWCKHCNLRRESSGPCYTATSQWDVFQFNPEISPQWWNLG